MLKVTPHPVYLDAILIQRYFDRGMARTDPRAARTQYVAVVRVALTWVFRNRSSPLVSLTQCASRTPRAREIYSVSFLSSRVAELRAALLTLASTDDLRSEPIEDELKSIMEPYLH